MFDEGLVKHCVLMLIHHRVECNPSGSRWHFTTQHTITEQYEKALCKQMTTYCKCFIQS